MQYQTIGMALAFCNTHIWFGNSEKKMKCFCFYSVHRFWLTLDSLYHSFVEMKYFFYPLTLPRCLCLHSSIIFHSNWPDGFLFTSFYRFVFLYVCFIFTKLHLLLQRTFLCFCTLWHRLLIISLENQNKNCWPDTSILSFYNEIKRGLFSISDYEL